MKLLEDAELEEFEVLASRGLPPGISKEGMPIFQMLAEIRQGRELRFLARDLALFIRSTGYGERDELLARAKAAGLLEDA